MTAGPASDHGSSLANVRLTEWTTCGGCAAKWGAAPLTALVADLAAGAAATDLLVGLAPFDDAAVLRITDDTALVTTTDFFPALVDEPSDFGAIAAANACSDIFAMGARVVVALNIAAFPERLPAWAVEAILSAAAEVVAQAGGVVAGGHTIRSEEPIFGLAVQGLVAPDRVWTKGGARPGDALVLSKPIGTGLVLADGDDEERGVAIDGMRCLNRAAADALAALPAPPHAVTDVTGFGLAGHAWEVANRSDAALVIDLDRLPSYPGALDVASRSVRTGGDARNRAHLEGRVEFGEGASEVLRALVFDPQTSGGLLAAVAPDHAGVLEAAGFWRIGSVEQAEAGGARVVLS